MKQKKNIFILLLTTCVLSLLFSACMDEETWVKQVKLPYSSQSYPIAPGDEVIIKGSGFQASDCVELEYYGYTAGVEGNIRQEVSVKKCSDKELVFIVPDFLEDTYVNVYLVRHEKARYLGEIYVGESVNTGGGSNVDNGLQVNAIIASEKTYNFLYVNNKQLDAIVIEDMQDGSFDEYRFERSGKTVWIEYRDDMDYDRFEILLSENLVKQIYSERKRGLVYSVQRQGEEAFTVNDETSRAYVETLLYPSHELFRFWREDAIESVEVLYDEYGFENNTTVNLNALLGYQYEDNLLNVLNLAGYLMNRRQQLAVRYLYNKTDADGTLLANDEGYYSFSENNNRVTSVQFVSDNGSTLGNQRLEIIYRE